MEHDELEDEWPEEGNYSYLAQALRTLATEIAAHNVTTTEAASECRELAAWALILHRSLTGTSGHQSSAMPTEESVPRETQLALPLPGSGAQVHNGVDECRAGGEPPPVAPSEADTAGERINRALQHAAAAIRAKKQQKAQNRSRRPQRKRGRWAGKLKRRG